MDCDLSLHHRTSSSCSTSSASLLMHCQLTDSPGVVLFFILLCMNTACVCVFVRFVLHCSYDKKQILELRCAQCHTCGPLSTSSGRRLGNKYLDERSSWGCGVTVGMERPLFFLPVRRRRLQPPSPLPCSLRGDTVDVPGG